MKTLICLVFSAAILMVKPAFSQECNYIPPSVPNPNIQPALMAGPCVSHNGFLHTPIGSLRIVVDALLNYCKFIDFNTKMFKL